MRLLLLAIGISAGASAQVSQPRTVAEQYLFHAVNMERTSAGLKPLAWNPALFTAAERHAGVMRLHHSIAHQFEGEPELSRRAADAGAHLSRVTENLATSGSVLDVHDALMHSAHHRNNILDPAVTSVGMAVVADRGRLWAVEDFGRDVSLLPLSVQEERVMRHLAAAGLAATEATDNARATCRMQTGYAGPRPWFVMRYTTSDLSRLPEQLKLRLAEGRLHSATVGACAPDPKDAFTSYSLAILLFP